MDINQIIGKNITTFRSKFGYTQKEISDYLGISQPAYASYESGKTVIPMSKMEKLALIYNVEEYDLMEENLEIFQATLACAFRKEGDIKRGNEFKVKRSRKYSSDIKGKEYISMV